MKKIMENKNLKKNKQISQTMSETRKKRQNQICRVFHVKIQENKLSKLQKEQLQMIFVEGKRYKNHILNWSNQDKENNKIWNFDTKIKEITISDKDKNLSQYKLQYIPASIKQTILDEMCANIKTLSSLKVIISPFSTFFVNLTIIKSLVVMVGAILLLPILNTV